MAQFSIMKLSFLSISIMVWLPLVELLTYLRANGYKTFHSDADDLLIKVNS